MISNFEQHSPRFTKLIKERKVNNTQINIQKKFEYIEAKSINALILKFKFSRAVYDKVSLFNSVANDIIDEDYEHIILDLSDILFLDSTYMGAIIVFYKKIKSKNKTMKMVLKKEKITLITTIDNLSKLLDIYETQNEALASIESDQILFSI